MSMPLPRRSGERWTDAENAKLVELLRANVPLADMARRLQRSTDAILMRCQWMLLPVARVRRSDAEFAMRAELAASPDYDWRAGLRSAYAERGSFYWDQLAENTLREGWSKRAPLDTLTRTTGASEIEIAKQLVTLRLASSVVEVAERLGCAPDATLDVRVRMAADRAAAAVWVLVADGLHGSERAKELDREGEPKAYRHVSIHASAETAEQTLVRLLIGHRNKGGSDEEVTVTLAQRTVGELAVGATHHEQAPALRALDTTSR